MKWARITNGGHGKELIHRGRKYPLSAFEGPGNWALYRGAEVLISGYHADGRGTYALLIHPADPHRGKVVPRGELTPL